MKKQYHRYSKHVLRTKRWKALRHEILERDDYACTKCGARARLEIDHTKPVRDRPDLAYKPSNLRTLCASCHTAKTRIECGHKPPDPRRVKWMQLVNDLEKPSKRRKQNAGIIENHPPPVGNTSGTGNPCGQGKAY